jgi:hypothetical protein
MRCESNTAAGRLPCLQPQPQQGLHSAGIVKLVEPFEETRHQVHVHQL